MYADAIYYYIIDMLKTFLEFLSLVKTGLAALLQFVHRIV